MTTRRGDAAAESPAGPLPVPGGLLAAFASLYGRAVAARNRRFDRGAGVVRLASPVISVGNLTVGGTGKTPLVAEIAASLPSLGWRPVVAMRGYGAKVGGRSDEQMVLETLLPGLAVVAGPDRVRSLREAGEPRDLRTVVVLDDGFQHRRIARDLDLVLVDATRPALRGRLLPAGWLREPAESLRRADAVVVTRAAAFDAALAKEIERVHGRPPIAWVDHGWSAIDRFGGGDAAAVEPIEWLAGRRVAVAVGIGRPEAFAEMARAAGAEVVAAVTGRDHQAYSARSLRRILAATAGAEAVLTTLKDWVKLRDLWPPDKVALVPRLALRWTQGRPDFTRLLEGTLATAMGACGTRSGEESAPIAAGSQPRS